MSGTAGCLLRGSTSLLVQGLPLTKIYLWPAVLAILLGWRVKRHRHNRRVWKRDLETARAKPTTSLEASSDSNSSNDVLGKKPLATTYMPFGVGSNESVDATPHAKHATGVDAFAGQRQQRVAAKAQREGRSTGDSRCCPRQNVSLGV